MTRLSEKGSLFFFCCLSSYNLSVQISAVIITLNEEKNIGDAIRSVLWADEVIVVDAESSDRTQEIAESLGAKVLINPWSGFSEQKQFAVDKAANNWILSLDADERVSPELRAEIDSISTQDRAADGYRIPRLSYYMGRAIKHGGWYPDLQLRLFDRSKGRWNGSVIHESVRMDDTARTERLRGEILHYSVENAAHHQRMIAERYAPLGARKLYEEGRRSSPLTAIVSSWFAFLRGYFLKLGFLDGFPGFCIAYFAAQNTFLKHVILMEMRAEDDSI